MVSVIRLNRVKNLDTAAFYSSKSCKLIKITLFLWYKTCMCLSCRMVLLQKFCVYLMQQIIVQVSKYQCIVGPWNDTKEVVNFLQRPSNLLMFCVFLESAAAYHGRVLSSTCN